MCAYTGAAALPLCSPSVCRNRSSSASSWAVQELPALLTFQQSWGCPHLVGSDLSYQSNFCVFLVFHCYLGSPGSWLSCCVVAGQLKLFSQPHMNLQINRNIAPWVLSNLLEAQAIQWYLPHFYGSSFVVEIAESGLQGAQLLFPSTGNYRLLSGFFCQLLIISRVDVATLIDNTRR